MQTCMHATLCAVETSDINVHLGAKVTLHFALVFQIIRFTNVVWVRTACIQRLRSIILGCGVSFAVGHRCTLMRRGQSLLLFAYDLQHA